jgi:2-amino-4-hydroxy-6-hydroxymethyldihydropteridine diphosphokinase
VPKTSYAVALGGNKRGRAGSPRAVLAAAIAALPNVVAASRIIETAPLGPSLRRYANAVALIESDLMPDELLDELQAMERTAGRRTGRRWGARVLDLDIVLWTGGSFAVPGLIVPHPHFRTRDFVLGPLAEIAPDWRDPVTRLTVRQLFARLTARARAPSPRAG